jgi:antitoxin component YwqK of YwqJK toxin-antitoxin module
MENKNNNPLDMDDKDVVILTRTYHKNGKLRSEVPSLNGLTTGTVRTFFNNGQVQLEFEYFKNQVRAMRAFGRNGELLLQSINGELLWKTK